MSIIIIHLKSKQEITILIWFYFCDWFGNISKIYLSLHLFTLAIKCMVFENKRKALYSFEKILQIIIYVIQHSLTLEVSLFPLERNYSRFPVLLRHYRLSVVIGINSIRSWSSYTKSPENIWKLDNIQWFYVICFFHICTAHCKK